MIIRRTATSIVNFFSEIFQGLSLSRIKDNDDIRMFVKYDVPDEPSAKPTIRKIFIITLQAALLFGLWWAIFFIKIGYF